MLLTLILILVSCEAVNKISVDDSNQDEVWHVSPDQDMLGNVDVWFIPNTLQGSAIWVINGPARAIGFDVTNLERTTYYYGDGYIGSGKNKAETGTIIPENQWILVRVVVYNTLGGGFGVFLESLGAGFFDSVEDIWIEEVFEAQVFLSNSQPPEMMHFQRVTDYYTK